MLRSENKSLDEDASAQLKRDELYPLIDLKVPEENEHCLFKSPAKLYRYANSEWKDHGPGLVSILEISSPKRWRILMRRDGTLKVCLNHYIVFQMNLIPRGDSGKCFCWMTLNEFSDGVSKQEILAIKFRTFEAANNFKRIFEECVEFARDDQKDIMDKSIEKKIKDKSVSPSVVGKKSAISVKENYGNVDCDKKGDLSGKSDKNEGILRKETLLSGEDIETKVLFNSFTNVQLNSQEGEQG
ncbi:unnamed protein product [Hymenolepis diminuta]|uniref:RanBD1 domain-containing protein n=1 Tax=Hymenolepis diminuta TaxID=6216 RepID=A0A564YUZ3_HYMDI|nr:unnamed protein product [Hymenolepis diminuta]